MKQYLFFTLIMYGISIHASEKRSIDKISGDVSEQPAHNKKSLLFTSYEYNPMSKLSKVVTSYQNQSTLSDQSLISNKKKYMKSLSMYLKTIRKIKKDNTLPETTRLKAAQVSNPIALLFVTEVEKELALFNASSNQNSQ